MHLLQCATTMLNLHKTITICNANFFSSVIFIYDFIIKQMAMGLLKMFSIMCRDVSHIKPHGHSKKMFHYFTISVVCWPIKQPTQSVQIIDYKWKLHPYSSTHILMSLLANQLYLYIPWFDSSANCIWIEDNGHALRLNWFLVHLSTLVSRKGHSVLSSLDKLPANPTA